MGNLAVGVGLFANGQPKPAFQAFLMPFDVRRNGQTAQMWGQVEDPPNSTPGDVYLRFCLAGSADRQPAGGPFHVDNPYGYWETQVLPPGPGVWRSVALAGGQPVTSREVSVSLEHRLGGAARNLTSRVALIGGMRRISLIVGCRAAALNRFRPPPLPARRRSRSCRTTGCCSSRARGNAMPRSTRCARSAPPPGRLAAGSPGERLGPESTSTQRPPGFDAAAPTSYPSDLWDRYDGVVRAATARGLSVILTPTSPIPAWASQCSGSVARRQSCRPDPALFGGFLRALGIRYSGGYADENEGGTTLPRVSRWGIWNEPDVGRWLTPQFVRRGGRLVPASPARYRQLATAAIDGLRATGHASDQILLGETAPIGNTTGAITTRPVATATFWRNLLCLDRSGRSLRGRAAVEQECTRPQRLLATAIAHHPYIRGGSRSPLMPARPDEITIRNLPRLQAILAQGVRRGRIAAGLPIYYTEYGFQTNPPDRDLGVTLARQAEYLNESDWITYRQPAVKGLAQYLLRDDSGISGFQSGASSSPTGVGSPATTPTGFRCGSCARG